MNRIRSLAICLMLLLPGCGPLPGKPYDLKQELGFTQSVQERYTVDEEWWRAYGDAQLDRLVSAALERNIDLARAAVNINKALYAARRAGADRLPELSGSGEGGVSRDISTSAPSTRNFSATGGISYEVDLWLRLADAASAKEWEYRATVEDREAARLVLVTSTTDLYFELMYLHEAMAVSRNNIKLYEEIHQIVSNRYRYGKVSALEQDQAAQAVLTEEKRLFSLDLRRREVENSLRLLLNYEPGKALGLDFEHELKPAPRPFNLDVPLAVLARRPDLKAAEHRLQGAFMDVKATHKSWYPSITISGALESSSDSLDTVFDAPFASGLIVINLPFLQWNKIKWNVKISEAEYELLQLDFENKLNKALNEVAMACAYYANAVDNLRNAEERYEKACNISDIYKEQYEQGKRELSDWLESMNVSGTAWLEVLENRYQTLRRTNEVYKTMAGRYQSVE